MVVDTNITDEIRKAIRMIGRIQGEISTIRTTLYELQKMFDEGRLIIAETKNGEVVHLENDDDLRDGDEF